MNQWETFQAFLSNERIEISVGAFVVNLALAAVLAWLLGWVYVRYAGTLSNRRAFASNFLLLTTTTTLIISIVKSSLALSLGLVGALSIVRFRAAIKEPEELAFLFLAIAIGLGLGADQRIITLVAFAGIVPLIVIKGAMWRRSEQPTVHLIVHVEERESLPLERIVEILDAHCSELNLQRFDDAGQSLEAAFAVSYASFEQLAASASALRSAGEGVEVSFLDSRGAI